MRRTLLTLTLCALSVAQAHAAAEHYVLDPVHTRVLFGVSHAGFSDALGTVSGSEGSLWFDPEDWASARLDVLVPLTRLDLGDTKWNQATLASKLLDGQQHPTARFVSSTVEPIEAGRARVHGVLTLRGVSQPVTLDVRLNALKRHPLPPFRRTAGFSATARISRSAFGISAWPSMIGDEVTLRIEVEAIRSNRIVDSATPEDSPPTTTPEPIHEP